MTAAMLLDLLTKGATYELHTYGCDRFAGGTEEDWPCDCSGPDLLKEIQEVLKRG